MPRPKKPQPDAKVARTTISMLKETFDAATANAKRRGFKNSFSAYIAWLIERDDEGRVQREDLPRAEK